MRICVRAQMIDREGSRAADVQITPCIKRPFILPYARTILTFRKLSAVGNDNRRIPTYHRLWREGHMVSISGTD